MKNKFLAFVMVMAMALTMIPGVALAATVLPDGVTESAFGTNTVYDGTTYYATLNDALKAIHGTDNAVLYCKPNADVGTLTHGHVCKSLTVYGNDAYISGGEKDFEIGFPTATGTSCPGLNDLTLTVKNLKGAGAWGNRSTTHTVNLVFEGCEDMGKVYLTGTTGTTNITITDSTFTSNDISNCKIYSNNNGTITLSGVDFSNIDKAINLNHKAESGKQTVILTDCTFTNCGSSAEDETLPVRVLSSVEGGVSELSVTNCTFTGTAANRTGEITDILVDNSANGVTMVSITKTAAKVLSKKETGNEEKKQMQTKNTP